MSQRVICAVHVRLFMSRVCYGCFEPIAVNGVYTQCPKCKRAFCQACDAFIHDNIFHCPGCLYHDCSVSWNKERAVLCTDN